VRFLTLGEIAVYSVMMQRTPIALAAQAALRRAIRPARRFAVRPELAEAETLTAGRSTRRSSTGRSGEDRGGGARRRGDRRAISRPPYAETRDALLEIRIGPPPERSCSRARPDGRLPAMHWFEADARRLYGRRFDARAILALRHDDGYWSFYLKTAPRLEPITASSLRPSAPILSPWFTVTDLPLSSVSVHGPSAFVGSDVVPIRPGSSCRDS
jgi:hypothetical protein